MKTAGLEKEAVLGGVLTAAALHIGQNVLAKRDIASPKFKDDAANHFLSGVIGRHGPIPGNGGAKGVLKGVYSPESVMLHNHAYAEGERTGAKLKKMGIDPSTATKRDIVKLRKKMRNSKSTRLTELAKGINAKNIKDVIAKPIGSKKPYHSAGIAVGNAIGAIAEPSLGIVNAVKYGLENHHVSSTALGKKVNDAVVYKPIRDAYKAGAAGKSLNPIANKAYSLFVNGPAGHAMMEANTLGSKKLSVHLNLASIAKKLKKV